VVGVVSSDAENFHGGGFKTHRHIEHIVFCHPRWIGAGSEKNYVLYVPMCFNQSIIHRAKTGTVR
jgi:hypothetical protein